MTAASIVPDPTVTEEYDVIVVGYGPTGQSSASLLARLGHRVAVLERWPTLYGMPRLCAIDGEAVRIVQAAGDVEQALAESSEVLSYDLVAADGEVLVSVDHQRRSCGFWDRISMYQPFIEEAMDGAARQRGATIFQGWEAVEVTQDSDGVRVVAHEHRPEGGPGEPLQRVLHAKYIIGADGGRSPVRESVGAEREDLNFYDAYLSIDVLRKRDLDIPANVNTTSLDPLRSTTLIPIGKNRIRFEFLVNPDDDHTHLLVPDVGYEMLGSVWNLTEDDVEIYRQVIYRFEGKITNEWRHGRIFIAGDAAHQMPPFAGQGACSGLRDSINLAWKLDLVLRGVSTDELLDTYTLERRPHALAVTQRAIALGRIACVRDPDEAAQRDAVLRSGAAPVSARETPGMVAGILHRAPTGDVIAPVGELIPQGVVTSAGHTGRFDDVVGWGFVLLGRDIDPTSELNDDDRQFLKEIGAITGVVTAPVSDRTRNGSATDGVIVDDAGDYCVFFDTYDVEIILGRPDFTVFGAVTSPHEVPALIADLRRQVRVASRP